MLSTDNLPQQFWGEALKTVVHICNTSPNRALDNGIPEEVWSSKPASYDHLKVFGCDAYVHIPVEKRTKVDMKSIKGVFMGYGDEGEMGYKVWEPLSRKIIRSRDVVFNEATLLTNVLPINEGKKKVKFQLDLPPIMHENQLEVENQPIIFEPNEYGQPVDMYDDRRGAEN